MQKKRLLIKSVVGQFDVRADPRWKKAIRLSPWIILLVALSIAMAMIAGSELPSRFGFGAVYIALGLGALGAFLIHCAICSYLGMRDKKNILSHAKKNDAEIIIDWRIFEVILFLILLSATMLMKQQHTR